LDNADLNLSPPGNQMPPPELIGSIIGTVMLQGRTDYSNAQVCADSGGTSICAQSDESGAYNIDAPEGNYTVTVTNNGYLAAEKLDVPVTAGGMTNMEPVTLLGGNNNDDCIVNILDLSLIGGRFRSGCSDTSWDARADINNDCSVDILDLSLTGGNFGKSCPGPWS